MKPGNYRMTPIFISSPHRTTKLTRLVEVIKLDENDGPTLVLIEELTQGPPNNLKTSGFLWVKGERKYVEPHQWDFTPVEDC